MAFRCDTCSRVDCTNVTSQRECSGAVNAQREPWAWVIDLLACAPDSTSQSHARTPADLAGLPLSFCGELPLLLFLAQPQEV